MAQDEIIVTAQKREQSIDDVAIDMSALTADDLKISGRTDEQSLSRQVPGLSVQSYAPTNIIFNIRGISQNDYANTQESPVVFYEDEVYSSGLGAISGRSFDLERVEVLRGPQGTLFGRNATGGVVHYITAKPQGSNTARLSLSGGSDGLFIADGVADLSLHDALRSRFSFNAQKQDGYIDNRVGPDVGSTNFYAGRLQFGIDVGQSSEIGLKLQMLRNMNERPPGYAHRAAAPNPLGLGYFLGATDNPFATCGGCDALGYSEPDNDPYTVSFNDPMRFDRKLDEATLRYVRRLGDVELTAIAAMQRLQKDYAEDSDMSPITFLTSRASQDLLQYSGELRLAGGTDKLKWVTGAYALKIRNDNDDAVDATNSVGLLERFSGDVNTRSLALFGQTEYQFAPKWSVVAGARYTHDKKRYDYVHEENGVIDLRFNPGSFPDLAKRSDGAFSYKLQLIYEPSDQWMFYGGIDRGTKSGGYSEPAILPLDLSLLTFEPETLTSFSAGAKAKLAGGKLSAALNLFHYIYDNYQAFENADGFTLSVRNKDALITGAELEASYWPFEGLQISGAATLLDTKVKDVILPSALVRDRQMPNAPEFSGLASVSYSHDFGPGTLDISSSWRYDGQHYFTTFNAPADRASPRMIGDARLAWRFSNAPAEIAFAVSNLTDHEYRIYDLDFSQNFGFIQSSYARPRQFVLTLTLGEDR